MFDMVFNPKWTTLKKLIWLKAAVLSGIASVIQTVTGNAPITLSNAVARAIKSLTRYGLCTQASTPTPDAPVDIMTNNGALTASKNIFDGGYTLGGTITNSGADGSTNAARLRLDYTLLPPGTYTLSTNGICNNTIVWAYSSATGSGATKLSPGSVFSLLPFTFTLSEAKYVRAMCRNSNNPTLTAENAGAFQIEAGESATEYMAPGLVYASGTPEVLTVRGKNLYDRASNPIEKGSISSSTGQNAGSASRVRTSSYIYVKPNTTYTISATIERYTPGASKGVLLCQYNADASEWDSSGWQNANGYTFTTGATTAKIRAVFAKASSGAITPDMVSNVQIEEGSTATAYEPYIAPQTASVVDLLGVGDYKDTHDIISGSIERNVGAILYDGSEDENWSLLDTNVFAIKNSIKKVGKYEMLCSHYVYTGATSARCSSGEFGCSSGNQRTVYFKNELYDTVEDWKAAIAADPIIVVYPLATPTTENVTPQHLHTTAGTNTVSVTAEVSPIEIKAEYMASE